MNKIKIIVLCAFFSVYLTACGKEADNNAGKENVANVIQSTDTNVTDIATDTDVESNADTAKGAETTETEETEINLEELIPSQMPDRPPTYSQEEFEAVLCVPRGELFTEGDPAYTVTEWSKEQTKIGKCYGICAEGEFVYVCDYENNCIVKLDKAGNFVESYGELGAEPGNFTQPTAIIFHEDAFYVLDQGNSRIQIFDKYMNYQKEIAYTGAKFYFDMEYFIDLAIDGNGTIYLSSYSMDQIQSYVYYIAEDGTLEKIKPMMTGYLTEYEGEVYAANCFYFCRFLGGGFVRMYGQNCFFKCNAEHLEQLAELPFKYAPGDFCILNDMLYTISTDSNIKPTLQINRITMEGEVDSVIQIIEIEVREDSHPWQMDVVDDSLLYVTDPIGGSVYKIQREE